MRCPHCSSIDNKVVDSRMGKESESIRRRRECLACQGRFTTYERVEEVLPLVVKKDGRREPFDRLKILNGLKKACEKRPVSVEALESSVAEIEKNLQDKGLKEIPSTVIGEEVMSHLQRLDEVAYVRFASVYRSFKDINEFMSELKDILSSKEMGQAKAVVQPKTTGSPPDPLPKPEEKKLKPEEKKPKPEEKKQKTEEKNKLPEKLPLPLDP